MSKTGFIGRILGQRASKHVTVVRDNFRK